MSPYEILRRAQRPITDFLTPRRGGREWLHDVRLASYSSRSGKRATTSLITRNRVDLRMQQPTGGGTLQAARYRSVVRMDSWPSDN
jgi:hypothetical protein